MDEEAFDAFYQGSFGRVVGQIYATCGDLAEAQDCVQEAFIRAWDHRHQLDSSRSPEAWVRTCAYRLSVSRWRAATRGRRPADRALQVQQDAEPTPDRIAVERALAKLPADQRRVIALYHVADRSIDQIAQELGIPSGTVKSRLARARTTLHGLLSDALPEETSHV